MCFEERGSEREKIEKIACAMEFQGHQIHSEQKDLAKQHVPDPKTPRDALPVRRNPPRRAKHTPAAHDQKPSRFSQLSASSAVDGRLVPFSIDDHIDAEHPAHLPTFPKPSEPITESSENLRVFLRIRPLEVEARPGGKPFRGNSKPRAKGAPSNGVGKNGSGEKDAVSCLVVNDSSSVTLAAPLSSVDSKRGKSEVFDGFSFVFPPESQQKDVYERVLEPLVVDFIQGKSGLLAAMGPTGSGKTHTMFGCPGEPGIVHLALKQIFCHENVAIDPCKLRSYYLSMFEIFSDRGKGERIFDLSTGEADLSLQQSAIRGLQEVMVSNIVEAESMISSGMLKRMTAVTNANCQSSRSQCVINIRCEPKIAHDGETSNGSVLTVLDLAGAERERRTGNQGARLLESNFINNTSMIFNLCLRSLLEHQKNPKRALQKHFQNSLLTRYLRDYMEGKKRMALILTVKPGEDDYNDSSFLLRQASPYMRIKFNNVEESHNAFCQKRYNLPPARLEPPKRRKQTGGSLIFPVDGTKSGKVGCLASEKVSLQHQDSIPSQVLGGTLELSNSVSEMTLPDKFERIMRNNQILQNFSKAFWNVLKQYKKKLKVSENDAENLRKKLQKEEAQFLELMKQLEDLKSHHCSCCRCFHNPVTSNSKLETQSERSTTASPSTIEAGDEPEDFALAHVNVLSEGASDQKSNYGSQNDSECRDLKEQKTMTIMEMPTTAAFAAKKLDPLVIPAQSLNTTVVDSNICRSTEKQRTSPLEMPFSEASASLVEDVGLTDRCDTIKFSKKENHVSSPRTSNLQKPRRRLLPASAMLLKELNGFDVETENPKGSRCTEGPMVTEQGGRSQGSSKLFRLLRSNLE